MKLINLDNKTVRSEEGDCVNEAKVAKRCTDEVIATQR